MDDETLLGEKTIQPLLTASNTSTLGKSLEFLIEAAKTPGGRSDLASKNILPTVIQLIHFIPYSSDCDRLLLSLKLLRNLCAGELANQDSFIEHNGVEIVSSVLGSVGFGSDSDHGVIRMGLQLLGNVSLAGVEHQRVVWRQLFWNEFLKIARIPRRETCDPLCMVIYSCCDGSHELVAELCGDQGLLVLVDIVRTASAVGFGEDWFKLLLSKICLDEFRFPQLFSKFCPVDASEYCEDVISANEPFASEQAYLLRIVSEILNERINDITVSNEVALCALVIFNRAVGVVDFALRGNSDLPTGSSMIDVLGYSLTILRDICAIDSPGSFEGGSAGVVDSLLSSGFLETLLCLLRDLEPPATIRKAIKQGVNQEGALFSCKLCPYKGFRRDIVAVIGNCAYRRKHVQDELRQKDAILLLLQQCVTDDENPFLREWGIWAVKNLLEGNAENQRQVAELELQESVDVPELTRLGLRVEVDEKTRCAKLVNVPSK